MNTKRIYAAMLLATAFAITANAQEETPLEKTTLMLITRPDRVLINRTDSMIDVVVEGQEGDPDYRYATEFSLGEKYSESTNMNHGDWNLSLPFGIGSDDTEHDGNFTPWFGVGFVSGLGTPGGMNVQMGESWEFMLDILNIDACPSNDGHWKYAVGFGVNWKNYRMTGHTRFMETDDGIALGGYPEGSKPNFSRIKVFSLTVPFTVAYSFNKHVSFLFSPILNFNTHASLKTRYKLDGEKHKEKSNEVKHNRVTLDLRAILSYDNLGLYVKYSPCNVLKTDYAPEFHGISTGVVIGF